MVYWKNCHVQLWEVDRDNKDSTLIKKLKKKTGKGTLSTGERLTFTGVHGKAKKG
jgi:hypothetical protein